MEDVISREVELTAKSITAADTRSASSTNYHSVLGRSVHREIILTKLRKYWLETSLVILHR
uniref:Uncharacterized protein n=1 Tax=Heterorhabditis bacteriophora TaxID=37862 RepID=A0A1I7XMZ6_HETBA